MIRSGPPLRQRKIPVVMRWHNMSQCSRSCIQNPCWLLPRLLFVVCFVSSLFRFILLCFVSYQFPFCFLHLSSLRSYRFDFFVSIFFTPGPFSFSVSIFCFHYSPVVSLACCWFMFFTCPVRWHGTVSRISDLLTV